MTTTAYVVWFIATAVLTITFLAVGILSMERTRLNKRRVVALPTQPPTADPTFAHGETRRRDAGSQIENKGRRERHG